MRCPIVAFAVALLTSLIATAPAPAGAAADAASLYGRTLAAEELGKVKAPGVVPALKFTKKDALELGLLDVGYEGAFEKDAAGFFSVKRGIETAIYRLASAEAAQRVIKGRLECQSAGLFQRVLQGPMADIGDVCAAVMPRGRDPKDQPSSHFIEFSRNNVVVSLVCREEEAKNLAASARLIDKQLLAWVEEPKDAPPKAAAPDGAGLPPVGIALFSGAYTHSVSVVELGRVKAPGVVRELKFTPKDFADLGAVKPIPKQVVTDSGETRTITGEEAWKDDVDILAPVSVRIQRLASAEEVQKDLKGRLESQGIGLLVRVLKGPLTEVGDICVISLNSWGDKKEEAQLSKEQLAAGYLWFVRNNVQVVLHGGRDANVDLVALARRIDKQLVAWLEAPKDAPPKAAAPAPAAGAKELPIVYRVMSMENPDKNPNKGIPAHDFGPGQEKRKVVDRFIASKVAAAAVPRIEIRLMPKDLIRGFQRPTDVVLEGVGLEAFVDYVDADGKVTFDAAARAAVERAGQRIVADLTELAKQLGQEKPVIKAGMLSPVPSTGAALKEAAAAPARKLTADEEQAEAWLKSLEKIITVKREGDAPDGAIVEIDFTKPGDPRMAAGLQVPDEKLHHLAALKRLRVLNLGHSRVTDAGLEHLGGLNELHDLDLAGCTGVTDKGLDYLKGMPLQRLILHGVRVTDAGLAKLKDFDQLQTLNLGCTLVTDAGLDRLRGLKHLRNLTLLSTKVTDAGLEKVKDWPQLESLDLTETEVTNAGLEKLKALPHLESLILNGSHQEGNRVTDAGLAHLKGLSQLKVLSLSSEKITDAGLANLKGLSQLRELYLQNTQVTDQGVKELQEALPGCKIKH
jgi:hypothetical protein